MTHLVALPPWRPGSTLSRALVALIAFIALVAGGSAVASPTSHVIIVGRGIDGVALGQTKAQVKRRLGDDCFCSMESWIYSGVGYGTPPVGGVDFTPNGDVSEVFAFGSRTHNHLTTSTGVGLGSTLASVERAYKSARCYFLLAPMKNGPKNGRCVIVSRLGDSDAATMFAAGTGSDAIPGSVDDVVVYVLASAATESITVSVSPKSIPSGRESTATVTMVVTSQPFFDFPNGVGIAGDHVKLSSTFRGERIGRVTDHGNGTYTATITASAAAGVAKIQATDGAATGQAKLRQLKP